MLSFNESDKEVNNHLRRFKVISKKDIKSSGLSMDMAKTKIGRMIMFKGGQSVIRLNFMPKINDPFEMGLLQHEIFHAVGFILSEINTPLVNETHESYAYLVQYLTEKIYSEL